MSRCIYILIFTAFYAFLTVTAEGAVRKKKICRWRAFKKTLTSLSYPCARYVAQAVEAHIRAAVETEGRAIDNAPMANIAPWGCRLSSTQGAPLTPAVRRVANKVKYSGLISVKFDRVTSTDQSGTWYRMHTEQALAMFAAKTSFMHRICFQRKNLV